MKLDQHFTDQAEAERLVNYLLARLDPERSRHYIEPSCGEGAFVKALRKAGVPRSRIRSVDIDRKLPADFHQDFLLTTRRSIHVERWNRATTVVIGNPPFGRNGKLAREFINMAMQYANWVCFVVPRAMHGANGCGSLDDRLELIYERQLTAQFSGTKAKCNWQEWFVLPEGSRGYRPTEIAADTQGLYEIVTKDDEHDLVIQRCGGTAGKLAECNGSGEGKYYIRSDYREVLRAFKCLPEHEGADLTTHQKSLSARMLHELVERALLKQYIEQIRDVA